SRHSLCLNIIMLYYTTMRFKCTTAYCLVAKASTRCPQRKVYGVTYSAKDGLLGGWSEFIYLKPGVKVLTLPEEVSPK
ncbi:hypothetical protein QUA56_34270, partial [Microcoleus sp. N3A4]|uniref:hypothetical protein n=1 Tax=Microcoleus sp. N3A4 TaxID=3055379 RepID=UPI002FCE9A3A